MIGGSSGVVSGQFEINATDCSSRPGTSVHITKSNPRHARRDMGFKRYSDLWVCFSQIPLPTGEGAAKRRVRGTAIKIHRKTRRNVCGTPHPARWRGPPSPAGRGIRLKHSAIWTAVPGQEGQWLFHPQIALLLHQFIVQISVERRIQVPGRKIVGFYF